MSGFRRVEAFMGLRILKRILELRPWSSVWALEDPRGSWGYRFPYGTHHGNLKAAAVSAVLF